MSENTENPQKTCTKCKQTKSLNDFGKDKYRKDGHHPNCSECRRKVNNETNKKRRAGIIIPRKSIKHHPSDTETHKLCRKCKIVKPRTEFQLRKYKTLLNHLAYCKPCRQLDKNKSARRKRNCPKVEDLLTPEQFVEFKKSELDTIPQYTCNICAESKLATEFYKKKDSANGLMKRCKECHNFFMSDYYKKNKDKAMERALIWNELNEIKRKFNDKKRHTQKKTFGLL